jgi:SAM-dependent methyltransferase
MVYCNPRPTEANLVKAYNDLRGDVYDRYFGTPEVDVGRFHGHPTDEQYANFRRLLDWIIRFRKKGRLLDVGCSSGAFLEYAHEKGFETYGIEIREVPDAVRKKMTIFKGVLIDARFSSDYFDIVSAQAILEHLFDPAGFIREVNRILKPGGILLLSGLPNYHSLWIRLGMDRFIGNRPLMHLNYFTFATLRKILDAQGFRILGKRCWGVSETWLYAAGWQSTHAKKQDGNRNVPLIFMGKTLYPFINILLDVMSMGSVIETVAVKS